MKKNWVAPEMEQLSIAETANAKEPKLDFDGDWTEIDGKWYRPGNGSN